jgi:DNA modification methylase
MLHVASSLTPGIFRLIYLDPPFLTGREQIGSKEGLAYDDRWAGNLDSYLPWLQKRLQAIFPLLCSDGSLVLHLDWRTTHHARVLLDDLFGREGFINEIIWHYTGGGRSKRRFSCKHDTLLWYSRGQKPVFNIDAVRQPYKPTSGYARSGIVAASGRKYLPDPRGTPVDDVWDIPIINPMALERTGYPTQKPLALLQRLISALTNPGDLVGDLCCGSGTTLVSAQQLGRNWLGCDISEAATECARQRLQHECSCEASIENL